MQSVVDQPNDNWTHETESSALNTAHNAIKLFAEWRRFWNLSRCNSARKAQPHAGRPVLVEKTPSDLVRMRLLQVRARARRGGPTVLQALLGADRTYFVAMLRHPLAVSRLDWSGVDPPQDCMRGMLEHWLAQQHVMLADMPRLAHAGIVRFEHFVSRQHAQGAVPRRVRRLTPAATLDALYGRLGLPASVRVEFGRARREYHGDWSRIVVDPDSAFAWIDKCDGRHAAPAAHPRRFEAYAARQGDTCRQTFVALEARINVFGYSLFDKRRVAATPELQPFLVGPQ